MSDGYRKQRNIFGNYGGSLLVTTLTGASTLVTPKPASVPKNNFDSSDGGYTVYLQRVHVHINTPLAGQTWSVQDSNGNSYTGAISTAQGTTTVGDLQSIPTQDPIQAEFDFGPEGIALPAGASLVFAPSATGAAGIVTWDAYQKLSSTNSFGS